MLQFPCANSVTFLHQGALAPKNSPEKLALLTLELVRTQAQGWLTPSWPAFSGSQRSHGEGVGTTASLQVESYKVSSQRSQLDMRNR